MPLTAAGVAKLAYRELSPALADHGFKRAPGMSGAAWFRPEGEELLLIYFQSSSGNGPGAPGYRFTVEISIGSQLVRFGGRKGHRIWNLLTFDEREQMRRLENVVKRKLPPPDPAIHGVLKPRDPYLEHWTPKETPYDPRMDVWFRYWDEDDLHVLMGFLGGILPRVVDRFLEVVSLPMDQRAAWFERLHAR